MSGNVQIERMFHWMSKNKCVAEHILHAINQGGDAILERRRLDGATLRWNDHGNVLFAMDLHETLRVESRTLYSTLTTVSNEKPEKRMDKHPVICLQIVLSRLLLHWKEHLCSYLTGEHSLNNVQLSK